MLSINNSEEFVNQHSILLKTTLYRFLYKYVSLDQEFSLTYVFNRPSPDLLHKYNTS